MKTWQYREKMVFSFLIIQTLLRDSLETGWEIQLDVAKFQF